MAEKTTTSTDADPKEIFRLGSDSKEVLSKLMKENKQTMDAICAESDRLDSEIEEQMNILEKVNEQRDALNLQLKELEDATPPKNNRVVTGLTVACSATMLGFYALINSLASFKSKEGHLGVLVSALLITLGVADTVFMLLWSLYTSTELHNTKRMKACTSVLIGCTVCAPIASGVDCFVKSYAWRLVSYISLGVVWLVAGVFVMFGNNE